MAFAFRSVGTAKKVASGNAASVGLPAGHVSGDLLVLVTDQDDNVVDSVNQSYVKKGALNSGTIVRQEVWYKWDGGAEVAPTVTHAAGGALTARIYAYSGGTGSGDPFSAFLQTANAGTLTATASAVTPNNGDIVLFITSFGTNGGTSGASEGVSGYSATDPSSWTERGDNVNFTGANDLNGSVAEGTSTGISTGTATATEGWSYTAASTNNVATLASLTVGGGGAAAEEMRLVTLGAGV